MPLDPSISLNVRAPQFETPNPIQTLMSVAQLRYLQGQEQLRQLQVQDLSSKLATYRALQDPNGPVAELIALRSGQQGMGMGTQPGMVPATQLGQMGTQGTQPVVQGNQGNVGPSVQATPPPPPSDYVPGSQVPPANLTGTTAPIWNTPEGQRITDFTRQSAQQPLDPGRMVDPTMLGVTGRLNSGAAGNLSGSGLGSGYTGEADPENPYRYTPAGMIPDAVPLGASGVPPGRPSSQLIPQGVFPPFNGGVNATAYPAAIGPNVTGQAGASALPGGGLMTGQPMPQGQPQPQPQMPQQAVPTGVGQGPQGQGVQQGQGLPQDARPGEMPGQQATATQRPLGQPGVIGQQDHAAQAANLYRRMSLTYRPDISGPLVDHFINIDKNLLEQQKAGLEFQKTAMEMVAQTMASVQEQADPATAYVQARQMMIERGIPGVAQQLPPQYVPQLVQTIATNARTQQVRIDQQLKAQQQQIDAYGKETERLVAGKPIITTTMQGIAATSPITMQTQYLPGPRGGLAQSPEALGKQTEQAKLGEGTWVQTADGGYIFAPKTPYAKTGPLGGISQPAGGGPLARSTGEPYQSFESIKFQNEVEQQLRTANEQYIKPFQDVRLAMNQVTASSGPQAAKNQNTADISLLKGFAHLSNPASVRLNGEMTPEQLGGLDQRLRQYWEKVVIGGGVLTKEQRREVVDQSVNLYKAQEAAYQQQRAVTLEQGKAFPNVRGNIIAPDIRATLPREYTQQSGGIPSGYSTPPSARPAPSAASTPGPVPSAPPSGTQPAPTGGTPSPPATVSKAEFDRRYEAAKQQRPGLTRAQYGEAYRQNGIQVEGGY